MERSVQTEFSPGLFDQFLAGGSTLSDQQVDGVARRRMNENEIDGHDDKDQRNGLQKPAGDVTTQCLAQRLGPSFRSGHVPSSIFRGRIRQTGRTRSGARISRPEPGSRHNSGGSAAGSNSHRHCRPPPPGKGAHADKPDGKPVFAHAPDG